jgi:hypothetical protein
LRRYRFWKGLERSESAPARISPYGLTVSASLQASCAVEPDRRVTALRAGTSAGARATTRAGGRLLLGRTVRAR